MANIWEKLSRITATEADIDRGETHGTYTSLNDAISTFSVAENLTLKNQISAATTSTSPKKHVSDSEVLLELKECSREYQQDILSNITKSYMREQSKACYIYSRPCLVNNYKLKQEFFDKKRQFWEAGYSEKELEESYGFICVNEEPNVEKLCREGIMVANLKSSCLGHSEKGVQLCKHADIIKPNNDPDQYVGYLVIFKLMKGRIKQVAENHGNIPLEPTPNFDCHETLNSDPSCTVNMFYSSQIYIYELGEENIRLRPRQVLPFAVVKVSYTPVHSSMPKLIQSQSSPVKLTPCPKVKEEDEEFIVWNGPLTIKGLYACYVNMKSSASWFKPAKLGKGINITHKLDATKATQKYLKNIGKLRRNCEDCWGNYYVNVCELQPSKPEGKSHFEKMMNYLGKHDCVAVQKLEKDIILLLLTQGELSYRLGLGRPDEYPTVLFCLFLSKTSRKKRQSRDEDVDAKNNCKSTVIRGQDDNNNTKEEKFLCNDSKDTIVINTSRNDGNATVVITVGMEDQSSIICDMELCDTLDSNIAVCDPILQQSSPVKNIPLGIPPKLSPVRSSVDCLSEPLFESPTGLCTDENTSPPKLDRILPNINPDVLMLPPDSLYRVVTSDNYLVEGDMDILLRTDDNYVMTVTCDNKKSVVVTPKKDNPTFVTPPTPETPTCDERKLAEYYTSPIFEEGQSTEYHPDASQHLQSFSEISKNIRNAAVMTPTDFSTTDFEIGTLAFTQSTPIQNQANSLLQSYGILRVTPPPPPPFNLNSELETDLRNEERPPLPDYPPPVTPPPPPFTTSISATSDLPFIDTSGSLQTCQIQTDISVEKSPKTKHVSVHNPTDSLLLNSPLIPSTGMVTSPSVDLIPLSKLIKTESPKKSESLLSSLNTSMPTSSSTNSTTAAGNMESLYPFADEPLIFHSSSPKTTVQTSPGPLSVYQLAFQTAMTCPRESVISQPQPSFNAPNHPHMAWSPPTGSPYFMYGPHHSRMSTPVGYREYISRPGVLHGQAIPQPYWEQPVHRPRPLRHQSSLLGIGPPYLLANPLYNQQMSFAQMHNSFNTMVPGFVVNPTPSFGFLQASLTEIDAKIDSFVTTVVSPIRPFDVKQISPKPLSSYMDDKDKLLVPCSDVPEELKCKPLVPYSDVPEELKCKPLVPYSDVPGELKCKPLVPYSDVPEELKCKPLVPYSDVPGELKCKPLVPYSDITEEVICKPLVPYSDVTEEVISRPLVPYSDVSEDTVTSEEAMSQSQQLLQNTQCQEATTSYNSGLLTECKPKDVMATEEIDVIDLDKYEACFMASPPKSSIIQIDKIRSDFKVQEKTHDLQHILRCSPKNLDKTAHKTTDNTIEFDEEPEVKCEPEDDEISRIIQFLDFDTKYKTGESNNEDRGIKQIKYVESNRRKKDDNKKEDEINKECKRQNKEPNALIKLFDDPVMSPNKKLALMQKHLDVIFKKPPKKAVKICNKKVENMGHLFTSKHGCEMPKEVIFTDAKQNLEHEILTEVSVRKNKNDDKEQIKGHLKHSLIETGIDDSIGCKKIKLEADKEYSWPIRSEQKLVDKTYGILLSDSLDVEFLDSIPPPVIDLTDPFIDLTNTPPIQIVKTVTGYTVEKSKRSSSENTLHLEVQSSKLGSKEEMFNPFTESISQEEVRYVEEICPKKDLSPVISNQNSAKSKFLSTDMDTSKETLKYNDINENMDTLDVLLTARETQVTNNDKLDSRSKENIDTLDVLLTAVETQIKNKDKLDSRSKENLGTSEQTIDLEKQNKLHTCFEGEYQKVQKKPKIDIRLKVHEKTNNNNVKSNDKSKRTCKKLDEHVEVEEIRPDGEKNTSLSSSEKSNSDHKLRKDETDNKKRSKSNEKALVKDVSKNSQLKNLMKSLDVDRLKSSGKRKSSKSSSDGKSRRSKKRKDCESDSDSRSRTRSPVIHARKSKIKRTSSSKKVATPSKLVSSNWKSKSPNKQISVYECGIPHKELGSFKIPKLSSKTKEGNRSASGWSTKSCLLSKKSHENGHSHSSRNNKNDDYPKTCSEKNKDASRSKSSQCSESLQKSSKSQEKELSYTCNTEVIEASEREVNNKKKYIPKSKNVHEVMSFIRASLNRAQESLDLDMISEHIPCDTVSDSDCHMTEDSVDTAEDLRDIMDGKVDLEVIDEIGTDSESVKDSSTMNVSDDFAKDLNSALPVYGSRTKHLSGDSKKGKSKSSQRANIDETGQKETKTEKSSFHSVPDVNNYKKDLNDNVVNPFDLSDNCSQNITTPNSNCTVSNATTASVRPIVIVDPFEEDHFVPSVDRRIEEVEQGKQMRITFKNNWPLHKPGVGYTQVELIRTCLHGRLEDMRILTLDESIINKSVALTLHKLNISSSVQRLVDKNDIFPSAEHSNKEVVIPGLGDLHLLEEGIHNLFSDVNDDNKGINNGNKQTDLSYDLSAKVEGLVSEGVKLEDTLKGIKISPNKGPVPSIKEIDKDYSNEYSSRVSSRLIKTKSYRHHPYSRKEKNYKGGWSFDIDCTLQDLMQNLTTCLYKERVKTRPPTSDKPRFANYVFVRSAIPEFLPDESDDFDLTKDAIPDFDERRKKAELLDTLTSEFGEDEPFKAEQNVYGTDAEPPWEGSRYENTESPEHQQSQYGVSEGFFGNTCDINQNSWEDRVQEFLGQCEQRPKTRLQRRKSNKH